MSYCMIEVSIYDSELTPLEIQDKVGVALAALGYSVSTSIGEHNGKCSKETCGEEELE